MIQSFFVLILLGFIIKAHATFQSDTWAVHLIKPDTLQPFTEQEAIQTARQLGLVYGFEIFIQYHFLYFNSINQL